MFNVFLKISLLRNIPTIRYHPCLFFMQYWVCNIGRQELNNKKEIGNCV